MEKLARIVDSAFEDVIMSEAHLMKLVENGFGLFAGHGAQASHLAADRLDLVLSQLAQQFGADLFAQRNEQNRRLADSGYLVGSGEVGAHQLRALTHPGAQE